MGDSHPYFYGWVRRRKVDPSVQTQPTDKHGNALVGKAHKNQWRFSRNGTDTDTGLRKTSCLNSLITVSIYLSLIK